MKIAPLIVTPTAEHKKDKTFKKDSNKNEILYENITFCYGNT